MEQALRDDRSHAIKAVFAVHTDTASGVTSDPAAMRRALDAAEVRHEWGLVGNAFFVAAPRSLTAGLDLRGRAFLHDYDPEQDPDGALLETILTAPLVVAHWINAQYFFSACDPEALGAGSKTAHNPVGALGVLTGPGGDLRTGLAEQSVRYLGRPTHEPVRLLAQDAALRGLSATTSLRPRRGVGGSVRVDGDSVVVTLPGRAVTLPAFAEPALRRLLSGPCTPGDLQVGGLDQPGALVLARRLLRDGAVVPA